MFHLLIIVFLVIIGIIVYLLGKLTDQDWTEGMVAFFIFAIIWLFIVICIHLVNASTQFSRFEDLKKIDALESVYKERMESLTQEFAGYLAELYPQHEKNIFDKIKPDKVDIYLAKYPDLKSSETIIIMVREIKELASKYYEQKVHRVELQRNIRYANITPWLLHGLIPDPPEELDVGD